MSNPLIKTKLPQISDNMPVEDVVNFISKTLNESKSSSGLSGSAGSSSSPIGTVIHSMLTLSQLNSVDYGWVLADGGSCAGSKYAIITGFTTVPDCTGRFLRGKGANNPDGSLALGAYTADKIANHTHAMAVGSPGGPGFASGGTSSSYNTGSMNSFGNETAPKNITVNIFIKIN